MKRELTSVVGVVVFACLVFVLAFADTSNANLPRVIGNFEDSNDGWEVDSEAGPGTTIQPFKGNATLGKYSLKVFAPSGWQKSIILDMSGEPNLLEDLGKTTQIKIDITMKANEWDLGTGWIKPIECVVIQDSMNGWQQFDPVGGATTWDGSGDQRFTADFDVPPQTPPDLTQARLLIVTSYGDVNKPGNFYFDNIRLTGKKTAETKKAAEPNKPTEPNKPAKSQ